MKKGRRQRKNTQLDPKLNLQEADVARALEVMTRTIGQSRDFDNPPQLSLDPPQLARA
jgi:hypothetical protein